MSVSVKLSRRGALALGGLFVGAAAAGSTTAAAEHPRAHPKIHAAIRVLKEAEAYLKEAKHDFGGHKAEAMRLIERTLHQLHQCLKH